MARAIRTFNVENCQCDKDHDSLEWLIASTLNAYGRGVLNFADEREIGEYIAGLADQVGWVQAGDEVADLRQLLDGVTGLDEAGQNIDFDTNIHSEDEEEVDDEDDPYHIANAVAVALTLQGNYLVMVKWSEGQSPQNDSPTILGGIPMTEDSKLKLIRTLQESLGQ